VRSLELALIAVTACACWIEWRLSKLEGRPFASPRHFHRVTGNYTDLTREPISEMAQRLYG
jgi:hypothetical protein